jgi:hypothetical protein
MVSVSVSSAILSVIYPDYYGVIDRFSLKALGLGNLSNSSEEKDKMLYMIYLEKIREIAELLNISPKEVDSTLMTKGFYIENKENEKLKNKLPSNYPKPNVPLDNKININFDY